MTASAVLDLRELPLFAGTVDEPEWMAHPGSELERRFREFHEECPQVLEELERRCFNLVRAGESRVSMKRLWEALRSDRALRADGAGPWKLNNDFTSLYGRLLIYRHPSLDGVIETRRRQKGAAA